MDASMERYFRLGSSSMDQYLNLDAFDDEEPQPPTGTRHSTTQAHGALSSPQQFVTSKGNRVPSEIISQIMNHLSPPDQRNCLMVSRYFHAHAVEHVFQTIHVKLAAWALDEEFDFMKVPTSRNSSWELLFHCLFDEEYGKTVRHVVVDNSVHFGNHWAQDHDLSRSCLIQAFRVMPLVSRLTWRAETKLCKAILDTFPNLQELEFSLPLSFPDDYHSWNYTNLTLLQFTYTPAWQSYCSMIEMQECIMNMVKLVCGVVGSRRSVSVMYGKKVVLRIPFFVYAHLKEVIDGCGVKCEVWMDMDGRVLGRGELKTLIQKYWTMRGAYPQMHYSSVLYELAGGDTANQTTIIYSRSARG